MTWTPTAAIVDAFDLRTAFQVALLPGAPAADKPDEEPPDGEGEGDAGEGDEDDDEAIVNHPKVKRLSDEAARHRVAAKQAAEAATAATQRAQAAEDQLHQARLQLAFV